MSPVILTHEIIQSKIEESFAEIGANVVCVSPFPEGVVLGIKTFPEAVKSKRLQAIFCLSVGEYQSSAELINFFEALERGIEFYYGNSFRHMRGTFVSSSIARVIKCKYGNDFDVFPVEFLVVDFLSKAPQTGLAKCWSIDFRGKRVPFHGGLLGLKMVSFKQLSKKSGKPRRPSGRAPAPGSKIVEKAYGEFNRLAQGTNSLLKNGSLKNKTVEDAISLVGQALKKLALLDDIITGTEEHVFQVDAHFVDEDGEMVDCALKFQREEILSLKEDEISVSVVGSPAKNEKENSLGNEDKN